MLAIRFSAVVIVSHAWFGECPTFPMVVHFTAEGLQNDLRFKLGCESSSFAFRRRMLLSIRLYYITILVMRVV